MPVELLASFMSEFWVFQKKHLYGTPDWEKILKDAIALGEKYNNDYCKGCILWCVDYIEQKSAGVLDKLYERLKKQ